MTIPFLYSLFYRPTGKANGLGYYGWLIRCFKTAFPSANPAGGIAENFGGSGLGEVVTEPPVFERCGGHVRAFLMAARAVSLKLLLLTHFWYSLPGIVPRNISAKFSKSGAAAIRRALASLLAFIVTSATGSISELNINQPIYGFPSLAGGRYAQGPGVAA